MGLPEQPVKLTRKEHVHAVWFTCIGFVVLMALVTVWEVWL